MADRKFSVVYRLMHWLIAICLILLLLTIFLRLTWLNRNNVADIIQTYLSQSNLSISYESAVSLAKQIRKPMWSWHIYLGCFLSLLFVIRIALHFSGHMRMPNPFTKGLKLKYRCKSAIFLLFYIFLACSLVTGLMIQFGSQSLRKSLEAIHSLSIYYLAAFIVIHLVSVFTAEFTKSPGLISDIISGKLKKS